MRTLIVDDEIFMLRLLSHQLNVLGFVDIQTFQRAADALHMLESGLDPVGLILCDLQMPEMDGVEFIRHLVRIGYLGTLILVSGEDVRILRTAEKLARAHRLDVLGSLQKPVALSSLRELVSRSLAYSRYVQRGTHKTYGAEQLQKAIANGELVNHYQPKVALATAAFVGVETLVRWQHPDDGLVFPDQFIAAAEENRLIDGLTYVVLTSALRQLRQWKDDGLSLHVAVNISMDSLGALDFPERVAGLAHDCGVPLNEIVLEITESRLMKNPLAPLDILTRLRLKHIDISIDDFGTGHSSLAQLHGLPFNELKIDRGFVHGAWRDPSLGAIFDASLSMARKLGMRTVAEGVEDREDWDFVRAAGCELAQGWFIAKPMPPAALRDWIVAWESRRRELAEPGA